MRKILTVSLFLPLFVFVFSSGYSQTGGSWVKKADISAVNRESAVGFAVNSKGYIGLGNAGGSPNGTMWEFDFATNVWTQKANMTGGGRVNPVAFVVSGYVYVGTGEDITFTRDKKFYQFNPLGNTWTARADFGGTARTEAVAFAIGTKGYVGTGYDGTRRKDFWEYDPTANTWTQKADFGGTARNRAVGFSIGTKGYIGTGNDGTRKKDFWEYDPATNLWTQKADLAGAAREGAVGFSVLSKGYIAVGDAGTGKADIWEYNPISDEWIQRANFTGQRRYDAAGFASSYSNKAYIGTGFTDEPSTGVSTKDFYEFTPAVAPLPPTNAMVTAFTETSIRLHWFDNSYDETGFIIERSTNGTTFTALTTVAANAFTYTDNGLTTGQNYYYRIRAAKITDGPSAATNTVSQITGKSENGVWTLVNDNYVANPSFKDGTSTFTINDIIYLTAIGGDGLPAAASKECWAYESTTNVFTQKATFGGEARKNAVAFVLNDKGYVGTGLKGPASTDALKDFWQYDPATNQWTQKADLGATGRHNSVGFTAGNKAYVGGGYLSTGTNGKDFYEYDPVADSWTAKADLPFAPSANFLSHAVGYNGKGYAVYTGNSPTPFYEYDPAGNAWTAKPFFPIKNYGFRGLAVIQDRLYGSTYESSRSTLWEFETARNRWIERAVQSSESQNWDANVATANGQLFYFTDKVLYNYNPLYGLKSPIVLSAEVIDPVKIKLTWSVDAAASKTAIYRALSETGPYELIAEVPVDKTIYVDDFDGASQPVYYKLRALNGVTQSDYSKPILATKRGAWKQLKKINITDFTGFGDVAVATSTRGYIGITSNVKTWWEYNPDTDSWTQKASFPGDGRNGPVNFSINDQVYVGHGYKYNSTTNKNDLFKDFWQYDPAANTWTQKKDFAGTARQNTASTSGNGKGYVLGGEDDPAASSFLTEAWEYNPADDSWVELPEMPVGVAFASAFVRDNKLWIMNGGKKSSPNSWGSVLQAYQFDFASGTWSKGANPSYYFSGAAYLIDDMAYFSISNMIGYNFTSKKWMYRPGLPATGYYSYRTFSLNKKIYAVTSAYDVWVYSPEALVAPPENLTSKFLGDRIALSWQNTTSQAARTKIQYASNTSNSNFTDLAVTEEGASQYLFTNLTPDINYKFRVLAVNADQEQSIPSNTTFENSGPYWTEISDVPSARRTGPISFVSSGKLYYGLGANGSIYFKDMWEFDIATGVWTQKADFGGEERTTATSFILGNDVYVGLGRGKSAYSLKDLWKFNAATNTWTASVNYPNTNGVDGPGVFVADGKAYLMGGLVSYTSTTNELWRFDGTTWVQLTSLPGETRREPIAFTLNGKAYIGSGVKITSGTYSYGAKDFWEYTISTDTWKQLKDLPSELFVDNRSFAVTGSTSAIVFTSPNGGYSGTGIQTRMYSPEQDKWIKLGNSLHMDYMSGVFTVTQDPATGFTYSIVNHYEFGVKLWRYDYLLDGPNLVEVKMASPNLARLKWRKITPRADSVVIYRSEIANTLGARMSVVKTGDTTATNSVSNGKTYYYHIRAYSNSGQFKTSSERTLTVDNPPAAPINLAAEVVGDNIVLTWEPGSGPAATSYSIERATSGGTSFISLGSSNTLTFTSTQFPSPKLSFRVKAVNGSGDSPYSDVVVLIVTGVEEEESSVHVYPNPTTDYITVELDRNDGPVTVQMLDNNGRKLYHNVLNSTTRVDMTHYPVGIYFINLAGSKTASNKYIKIVKK